MTDHKYIIFGQYIFSERQVFIGEADTDIYATISANVGANILSAGNDKRDWVSNTDIEIVSYISGLNFLTIHILEIENLNQHELSKIRNSRPVDITPKN